MHPIQKIERIMFEALKVAARNYADQTDGTRVYNANKEYDPLYAGSALRTAAKDWRKAERTKLEYERKLGTHE